MLYKVIDQLGNAGGDQSEERRKRSEDLHQKAKGFCRKEGSGFATVVGKALGDHFAEKENDDRTQNRADHGERNRKQVSCRRC